MTEPDRRTPTYAPHLRIIASGLLGPVGAAWEIFSYSLAVGIPNGPGLTITPALMSDYADDVVAFHGRVGTLIQPYARLTAIKVAIIKPDGKWDGGDAYYERAGLNVGGGGGGAVGGDLRHAPQVSQAVTLRTATTTARGRGRFYLPLPTGTVSSTDGLMSAPNATSTLTSAVTLINDLNNEPGIDGSGQRVVVASSFGLNYPVTSVSVGRALDVIRTRRNNLQEAYVTAAVA